MWQNVKTSRVFNSDKMCLIPCRLLFHASRLDSCRAVACKCHEPVQMVETQLCATETTLHVYILDLAHCFVITLRFCIYRNINYTTVIYGRKG